MKRMRQNYLLGLILCCMLPLWLYAQPSQWQPRGIGGGGALFFPSFNPHVNGELYLACDMSEFFHSTNFGESWVVPDFRQLIAGSSGRIQFTSNPSILFGLDGRQDMRTPTKSTDGGATWNLSANDPTSGEAYSLFTDVSHSNRLLVSDYSNLYYSANGGTSFSTVFSNGDGCYVAGAFFDNDTIYVGTNAGLLISTNAGVSFALSSVSGIPVNDAMMAFSGARRGNTVRLVCLTANSGDVYPGIWGGDYGIYSGTYTLDIGQTSWTSRTSGIAAGLQPFFLAMAVNCIDTIYAAGANTNAYAPLVIRSTNGGLSWSNVFLSTNNQNINTGWLGDHGDINWGWAESAVGFAVAPFNIQQVLISDWGFAHLSTNAGNTWKQVYVSTADQNPSGAQTPKGKAYHGIGIEPTSCWQVMWADSLHLIGSYTDIQGIRSTDAGQSWAHQRIDTNGTYSVNTIYHTVKHPVSGTLYAATSSVHDMYQSTYLTDSRIDAGLGQIWYSADTSKTWRVLHDFAHPVIWLALDPNNNNRMLASVVHSTLGGIYQTSDLQNGTSATWTRLAVPPRTQGHPFNVFILNDGTYVCTYSGRRAGSPQAFTQSSGVFVSTNGGTSWLDRSSPEMVYWTKDIVIDPHDAAQNTWFAAVHRGWGGAPNELGGVFKTTNRGVSWQQISDHLYAESCAISPTDSNVMYLSTETEGLWYCQNLRSASPTFTEVTGAPFVHPLRVFFNPYRSGEVWLTSFGNGMRVGVAGQDSLSRVEDLTIYPSGSSIILRWGPVAGANSYFIIGSITEDFSISDSLGTTSGNTFEHTPAGVKYFYRVIASE